MSMESVTWLMWLEMHDEIFHFEIFKNFMKFFEIFQDPFLKYFMKFLIFNIKWLKILKNMIKVYKVSRRYIMLIMHNNKYLPSTGLLTLLQWTIQPALHSPSSGKIFRYLWCEMTSIGPTSLQWLSVLWTLVISYWKMSIIDSFDVHL